MKCHLSKSDLKISWIAQVVAALIMCETLFYKFTGAEESIYIFSTIGIEPWGRYMVGGLELIASILLIIPMSVWIGAMLTAFLMLGALFFHITKLGFIVRDDNGELFFLALIVFLCSLLVLYLRRSFVNIFIKNYEKN